MEPVRVCCFCLQWSCGGIEAFLTDCLSDPAFDGTEIDIVAPVIEESHYTDRLKKAGISFFQLSGRRWAIFKNAGLFYALMRKRRYTAVHFNLYEALSLCYLAVARRAGIKTRIVHAHQAGLRKSPLRPIKLLIHKAASTGLAGYATERWACSRQAGEFFFPKGAEFEIIPNGISISRFRFDIGARERLRRELNIGASAVVGTVGRLSGEKNYAFLLELFCLLHRKITDTVLLIAGSGEELFSLENRAKELGISDSVIFFGETEYPEQVMSAMDIFVLPSLVEGFGRAAVEAQANGLFTLCSENVSAEAALTPLFCRIPLLAGAEFWAEKAAEALLLSADRCSYADILLQCGYDRAKAAQLLKAAYLSR